MKKLFLTLACLTSVVALFAQEKVKEEKVKEVVTSDYDRNGLSIIVVTRGDQYDAACTNYANLLVVDEKFDSNDIVTKTALVNKDRKEAITQEEADAIIAENGIAKEIMSFFFNRKADGSMDDSLLMERGKYNAKDQDIINTHASKVSNIDQAAYEWGEKLVNGGYVVIMDFVDIHKPEDKNGKKSDHYVCDVNAFAYKIDCNRDKLDEFYMNCWASASDKADQKAKAKAGFDAIELNMVPVATVASSSSNLDATIGDLGGTFKGLGSSLKGTLDIFKSSKAKEGEEAVAEEQEVKEEEKIEERKTPEFPTTSVEYALNNAYNGAIAKLENKIPAWNVAVTIASTKPLKAKIGKKEGLTNGKRFRSYSYEEDEEGNLVSKPRGYLRATKIVDNRGIATGSTEASEFYQISGVANIDEGWTIKQKNDIRLGAAITAKIGGFNLLDVGVDLDYLIYFSKIGSFYAMLNVGTDPLLYGQKVGDTRFINVNFGAGVGYGLNLSRFFELTPYAVVGADYMQLPNKMVFEYLTTEENKKTTALFIEPGLRFAVQLYPLAIFVKGGYDLLLSKDTDRTHYNWINQSVDANRTHKSGVFGEIGVKWTF